ncbi:hypothetical protein IQ244_04600 [Nostoc sp. LEGE 06077]|uniref:hypothetical protein n=1 Tax=Nostoc sp. LEGE 06077 TaxID=915325 RepID=UPI0018825DB1|nr:hypothetical protein [Nostoc sp. LEGE 06077]MBE9205802.1 hypothetical protein [Nostoc sp. LEGE 06077]
MASDSHEQQQQNSASGRKVNGEEQSSMSSDEIKAGSKEMMTHAQRQAFLKKSSLGKLFGIAHLLPEVAEVQEETPEKLPKIVNN